MSGVKATNFKYLIELVEIPSQQCINELMNINLKRATLDSGLLVLNTLPVKYLRGK